MQVRLTPRRHSLDPGRRDDPDLRRDDRPEAHLREMDVVRVEDRVASQSEEFHRASLRVIGRYFGPAAPLQELPALLSP